MKATLLCVCTALCLSPAASAQAGNQLTPKEPQKKERKLRKELQDGAFRRWLDDDVGPIITDTERQAFLHLATDDERAQFIEIFWLNRDPTPDTQENEYKEEHYRRIAYANERFASGIPGSKTDRGQTYIRFGPPDELESHPTGGPYQQSLREGGGQGVAYPYEVWRYRYLDGIGTDIVIEFVDQSGSGEYRMLLDPSEKNALLHTPGGQPRQIENLPDPKQFEALTRWAELHRPPPVRFKDLEALIKVTFTYNMLPMKVRTDVFRLTAATAQVPVTVQFDNRDLEFKSEPGLDRATVNLHMRITSQTRRVVAVQEDVLSVEIPTGPREQPRQVVWAQNGPAEPAQTARPERAVHQMTFFLAPGSYKLAVAAKDVSGGAVGTFETAIHVPALEDDELASSNIVLADLIEKLPARRVGTGPFVLGDWKVRPRVPPSFGCDETMGIYLQLYGLTPRQEGQSGGSLRYEVLKAGSAQPALSLEEDLAHFATPTARQAAIQKVLPLATLSPGDYTLKILVTDHTGRRSIAPEVTFSVR